MPSKHTKRIRRFAPPHHTIPMVPKVKKISALQALWILNVALFFTYASSFYAFPLLKSSVLEYSNIQSDPFDGATMPVAYVPNWLKTQNTNKSLRFDQIPSSEFIETPEYNIGTLENEDQRNNQALLSRYTYPVVYMGSYRLNYKEYDGSHLGVDIRAPIGTPALAVANGVVVKTKDQESGDGKYVIIRHDKVTSNGNTDTYYSSYLHLSEIIAEEGTKVKKGEVIGKVGMTGIATTPHLHFQIDKESAPFHTYWPYNFSDLRDLGLDFFGAVNVGLGKENAIKYTIHPLEFVQNNKNIGAESKSFAVAASSNLVAELPHNSAPSEPASNPVINNQLTSTTAPVVERKPIVVDTFVRDANNIFRDVPKDSPFYESTKFLFEKGVTMWYSDSSFSPKGTLTRSEALLMLFRYYNVNTLSSDFSEVTFEDVLPSSELTPYLASAIERKVISPQTLFRPNDLITRWETITLLVRLSALKSKSTKYKFGDVKTSNVHADNINIFATALKLKGKYFYPDKPMTRWDLAKILYAWNNKK